MTEIEEMQNEIATAQEQIDEGLRRGLGEDAISALAQTPPRVGVTPEALAAAELEAAGGRGGL